MSNDEGFTWGYYLAPFGTSFHIQPLSGLPFCEIIYLKHYNWASTPNGN